MKLLGMDTSSQALSVCISENNRILANYTTNIKKNHSLSLLPVIDELMRVTESQPKELEKIIVAKGPGSYTGLRIGVTTAKTLAWTLHSPLYAVSSLAVLAANYKGYSGWIIPLYNARRNCVYTGAYKWQEGKLISVLADRYIEFQAWIEEIKKCNQAVLFVGDDAKIFEEQIKANFPSNSFNEIFEWDLPNAACLIALGLQETPVRDIQGFVPSYLKRVEAEENWLKNHADEQRDSYVEKI